MVINEGLVHYPTLEEVTDWVIAKDGVFAVCYGYCVICIGYVANVVPAGR